MTEELNNFDNAGGTAMICSYHGRVWNDFDRRQCLMPAGERGSYVVNAGLFVVLVMLNGEGVVE